jgi:sulfopyruvate decarboxylase subunit alpha
MSDGPAVTAALAAAGVTHVVWVPDSVLGRWESSLAAGPPTLVRACREGEAIGLAAGLLLGGAHPIVMMQSTGFFEAGDAFRNTVHDLKLPLPLLVGVRSRHAVVAGRSADPAAVYAEPVVRAWGVPYCWLDDADVAGSLAAALRGWQAAGTAGVALLAE